MKKYPTKLVNAQQRRLKFYLKRDGIDIKFNLRNYEFSPLPKSLFSSDGTMHNFFNKSELAAILDSLTSNEDQIETSAPLSHPTDAFGSEQIVAIVDGVALIHTYNKPKKVS